MRFWGSALLASYAVATVVTPAAAAGVDGLSLEWSAPSVCPNRDQLIEQVQRLLAHSTAAKAPVNAAGIIHARAPGSFTLELRTQQGERVGERTIEGANCGELSAAAALIVALAIDPDLVVPAETSSPAQSPAADERPAAAPPSTTAAGPPRPAPAQNPLPPPPVNAAPRSDRNTGWPIAVRFGPMIGVDVGSLPGGTGYLGGYAGVTLTKWQIELFGSRLFEQREQIADAPARGADLNLWVAGARSCYTVQPEWLELGPCLGFEGGQLRAAAFGTDRTGSGDAAWLALRAEAFARRQLIGPLAARLQLVLAAPLRRPEFVLENVGSVFRPPAVIGRAEIGLELRFE